MKDGQTDSSTSRYSFADVAEGVCPPEMLGKPKPAQADDQTADQTTAHNRPGSLDVPEALPALPDMSAMTDSEIAQTAVRLLREATIEVFHKLGAGDWLYDLARNDPKNFLKMLQRLLPQSIEATVTVQPFEVPRHIRDLTVEDLRAMQARPATPNMIDVPFTEVRMRARGKAA